MKTLHFCDFCNTASNDKAEIEKHEAQCSFNPKRRVCWSCKHHRLLNLVQHVHFDCLVEVPSALFMASEGEGKPCDKWEEKA